jgi:cystathionine beta-lyase/cystathionine gamma-synthase
VRGGLIRSEFEETSEALFLTSGFVCGSAEEAEAAFAGETDCYIYSRYGNPTIAMLEEWLRQLEGAEAARATASGMAAVFNALAATLVTGDRVVASRPCSDPVSSSSTSFCRDGGSIPTSSTLECCGLGEVNLDPSGRVLT